MNFITTTSFIIWALRNIGIRKRWIDYVNALLMVKLCPLEGTVCKTFYIAWRVHLSRCGKIYKLRLYIYCHEIIGAYIACVLQQEYVSNKMYTYHTLNKYIERKNMRCSSNIHRLFLNKAPYSCVYTHVKQHMHMSLMMFWDSYWRILHIYLAMCIKYLISLMCTFN